MRYCGSGVISHEICNHEILWFWCNISRNLQPWDIVMGLLILMIYLIKSETTRYLKIIQNNQINKVKLAHHRTEFRSCYSGREKSVFLLRHFLVFHSHVALLCSWQWQHNRNPFQLHSKPQLHLKSCLFCGTPPPVGGLSATTMQIQRVVFFNWPPLKSSKYKQVNLG